MDQTPKETLMPRGRVDIIRKQAEHLVIVTAPNVHEAMNSAVPLFRVEPAKYSKLMITKIEEREPERFID